MHKVIALFYLPFTLCIDEALRTLLPYSTYSEFSEKSQEITSKFSSYLCTSWDKPLRAFEITNDEEIDSLVLTDSDITFAYGSAVFSYFKDPSYIHLYNFKVAQNYRKNGLGSALFQYLLDKKYPLPLDHIKLELSPSDYSGTLEDAREKLLSFYTKQGVLTQVPDSNQLTIKKAL